MPFVYILRCSDGTFYVGHTNDVDARLQAHNDGCGSDYTAKRRPVVLAYVQELPSTQLAVQREHQLKRWSGKKKAALIEGGGERLRKLSRRHRYRSDAH